MEKQPPHDAKRGALAPGPVKNIGCYNADLGKLVLGSCLRISFHFRKEISEFGFWKYLMAAAPDNVLLELFQIVKEKLPEGDLKKLERISETLSAF